MDCFVILENIVLAKLGKGEAKHWCKFEISEPFNKFNLFSW